MVPGPSPDVGAPAKFHCACAAMGPGSEIAKDGAGRQDPENHREKDRIVRRATIEKENDRRDCSLKRLVVIG